MNAAFVDNVSSGYLAGLLTLFGSYMGTQAQSVGLDRIYGGFSRADRMVLTLVALVLAAWQAHWGVAGIEMSDFHWLGEWALLGNSELNGMTFALGISGLGRSIHIPCQIHQNEKWTTGLSGIKTEAQKRLSNPYTMGQWLSSIQLP